MAGQWSICGYRRIGQQLRRENCIVDDKRLQRLMHQIGIAGKQIIRKRRTTNSAHTLPCFTNLTQNMDVSKSDRVWVADVTYIRLGYGFTYVTAIVDVLTRNVRVASSVCTSAVWR